MSRTVLLGWLLAGLLGAPAGAAELSDPTRPALLPPAPTGGPVAAGGALQSLFISEARRVAVIGGSRFEVGDRIGDSRIVAIDLSGVRLRDGGGEWRLTLTGSSNGEHGIKQPSTPRRNEP